MSDRPHTAEFRGVARRAVDVMVPRLRGDAAKDIELLVCVTSSPSFADRSLARAFNPEIRSC